MSSAGNVRRNYSSLPKLFNWQDCAAFSIGETQELYRHYVSGSQVDLIGSFGFGRTTAKYAEGIKIYTDDGREILDFTGGIGVLNHGHNHPRILKVRREFQEQKKMEVHKNFLSQYVAGLSHNIAQLLPEDLKISYFCNSGAEAVEGAVKLAYKYHSGNRDFILHSHISFHGKLLGAGGLTASPEINFKFPSIPNTATFQYNDIASVKAAIQNHRKQNGESNVYAIILEPLNGSSLRECSKEFLTELRNLCSRENIVLIFDEVYTGWTKTGTLFNFMKHEVVPDILCYAKSFGGGKSSISGYTTRTPFFKKAYDNMTDATLHSTTYFGFGEECVTAIEAINIIVEDDYVQRSQRIHKVLNAGLLELQKKYPDIIGEVRGSGALNGIIVDANLNALIRAALSFVPGNLFSDSRFIQKLVTGAIISELYNQHNILTFFGSNIEVPLIISPPVIAEDEHLHAFLTALDKTLAIGKMNLVLKFAKFKFLGK